MKPKYLYTGCFVSPEELFEKVEHLRWDPLEREIRTPHVTFVYQPKQVDDTLFGQPVDITIDGYGNDGYNEGVAVTLTAENPAIMELYEEIDVPHITLAVSQEGKPVDTWDLDFEPVEPLHIRGIFGAYTAKGNVILKPFQHKPQAPSGEG